MITSCALSCLRPTCTESSIKK